MSETVSGPTPTPASRPARWLLPLLVVSLAVNLLVAGILVAGYFRPPPPERMSGSPSFSQILPRSFFRELSEDRRQQLREIFGRHRGAFREDKQALRDSALGVADALAREPFDAAVAKAAIDAYGARSRELVDLGMTVANEVVDRLGTDERKILAQRIRDRATAPSRAKKPQ